MKARMKYIKRQPIYQVLFGFMRAMEHFPGVNQGDAFKLFIKEFEYSEEEFGIKEESLLREYHRMKDDFLTEPTA